MADYSLTELIPEEILQKMQDAFSEFVGMAALITDANGEPVTKGSGFTHFCMDLTRKSEVGSARCEECDRNGAIETLRTGCPCVYQCHAGLLDYAAPIMADGEFVGSFIGGQVRTCEVDEEVFREKAKRYGIDPEEYVRAAKETNILPQERVEQAAHFLSEMAGILSSIALDRKQALEKSRRSEKAAKNRNNFLSQLSADLQSTMSNMMQLLSESTAMTKDSRLKREADDLLTRTIELTRLTEETVEYMNIMDDEFELHEQIYDVRSVVELAIIHHEENAKKKNVRLKAVVDPSVPHRLYGDPIRLEKIIGTMIRYGVQYTRDGEVHVAVYACKESYATVLQIRVTDDGDGMSQENQEMVQQILAVGDFNLMDYKNFPLYEVALTGHVVRLMSGRLTVDSVLGKGTAGFLEIPQLAL